MSFQHRCMSVWGMPIGDQIDIFVLLRAAWHSVTLNSDISSDLVQSSSS
jgi:hypothetical protein